MSQMIPNGSGPSPDAAEAARGLLDLAHAALPSTELAGVLAGTTRAAAQLPEPRGVPRQRQALRARPRSRARGGPTCR